MISYYTSLIVISWMALAVLCILVHENSWIPKADKRLFYLTYGIIALSALTEWVGIQISGNIQVPAWVLSAVKCMDYILTPMAGGAVVAQMKLRNRWSTALMIVLTANAVLQIVSAFNQWMVVIDEHNHYTHGPLYGVYILFYVLVIILTAAEFFVFGLSYRRQNRASLFSIFLVVIIGVGIQEMLGGEHRTAYVALTMGVALMFIHYAEFYKMSADEHIKTQTNQLMKDALTGVFSRHAYMTDLERYRDITSVPKGLAAFAVDINGLKRVNDTQGHDAGDELIIGAARCIDKAVGDIGKCYRTGGDEFVVLTYLNKQQANDLISRMNQEAEQWSREKGMTLSFAAGAALAEEFEGLTVEELIKKADQAMYAVKAAYYQSH